MKEIVKIIEGYNHEKALLVTAINEMTYYSDNASQLRVKDVKERIATIDKILSEITASLLNPTPITNEDNLEETLTN